MQKQPDKTFRIAIVLFDGFSNMVLSSAVEPLRAACNFSGSPLFTWQMASLFGEPVRSSSGLLLQPERSLCEIGDVDSLVVVAGYGVREIAHTRAPAEIGRAARKARYIVGLDMGSWLMASAGLLNGRRATVHWHEYESFREEFLDVELLPDNYVSDGNRITAGGAAAVLELTLDLIRQRGGDALAYDVQSLFRQETPSSGSFALSPQLARAVWVMHMMIDAPSQLDRIAEMAAVSVRTLERLFHRELSVSAGQYYRNVRLARAQDLAQETALPASAIAARTGFSSASTLARAYRTHFGKTLSSTRRAHRRGHAYGVTTDSE